MFNRFDSLTHSLTDYCDRLIQYSNILSLKIMREREMSVEDPVAMQHGATGSNGGADGGHVKWSNMTPGAKKPSAAQRIGIGRPR